MGKTYLDNAATTKNKPEAVKNAMIDYLTEISCSPGRGGYKCSLKAGRIIFEARNLLAKLFNVPQSKQVIFTHNITHSLNIAIKGLLDKGDHVITTSMEHNSVLRPLNNLEKKDIIEVDYIKCDCDGLLDTNKVKEKINNKTKMIIITHASNVSGTLMPINKLGKIAKKYNLFYIIDTAQTAGIYDIDFLKTNADILAFTGHKSLMGPTGTGGFAVSKKAANRMDPLIEGGTGSKSNLVSQPEFLPDKFESGTLNTVGIAGLKAGVEFILEKNLENIRNHERTLADRFLSGIEKINNLSLYGPGNIKDQTPTFSITIENKDMAQLSFKLDDKYGIMTRSGLHCAPMAHKTIGTYPKGTLRFSIGYFNKMEEIDYTLTKLDELA
jgi:cysteine desulfurase family protein